MRQIHEERVNDANLQGAAAIKILRSWLTLRAERESLRCLR